VSAAEEWTVLVVLSVDRISDENTVTAEYLDSRDGEGATFFCRSEQPILGAGRRRRASTPHQLRSGPCHLSTEVKIRRENRLHLSRGHLPNQRKEIRSAFFTDIEPVSVQSNQVSANTTRRLEFRDQRLAPEIRPARLEIDKFGSHGPHRIGLTSRNGGRFFPDGT